MDHIGRTGERINGHKIMLAGRLCSVVAQTVGAVLNTTPCFEVLNDPTTPPHWNRVGSPAFGMPGETL